MKIEYIPYKNSQHITNAIGTTIGGIISYRGKNSLMGVAIVTLIVGGKIVSSLIRGEDEEKIRDLAIKGIIVIVGIYVIPNMIWRVMHG